MLTFSQIATLSVTNCDTRHKLRHFQSQIATPSQIATFTNCYVTCLSPRIRIRPVSPPASYYPSFRCLHIQVNARSTQYLAVQRSALIVDHNTYLFQNRGTEWLYLTAHWSVRGQTTDHAGDWLKTVVHRVHVTVSLAPFVNTTSNDI